MRGYIKQCFVLIYALTPTLSLRERGLLLHSSGGEEVIETAVIIKSESCPIDDNDNLF